MYCNYPIPMYYIVSNGNLKTTMTRSDTQGNHAYDVPCGICWKCRRAQSREWAVRIMHEASLHKNNTFITLTYNDENLPEDGSLVKKDFQDFMKRLRFNTGWKIRYYQAGEYGSKFDRPHYHAILFGVDFPDKKKLRTSKKGIQLYRSKILEKAWTLGFSSIGDVTIKSASYVAQYCTKKITGKKALEHYQDKIPEYATMSRSPAIGEEYFNQHREQILEEGSVQYIDHRIKIPRLYRKREKTRIDYSKNSR